MVTTLELLSYALRTLQLTQHILSLAANTAASHTLKSILTEQLTELDQIESMLHAVNSQRGWECQELQPASRWLAGIRFRCRNDRDIAEYMIYLHTNHMIRILRCRSNWDKGDSQARIVLQKYLDHTAISIREMFDFL